MLIISSPRVDFTVEEIEALDAYFERNGNAMIFYDISIPELPVFERFMAEWGIKYESVLVADSAQAISNPTNLAPSLLSHALTENLTGSGSYVVVPAARQISLLFSQEGWRTVTPLLASSSTSYGKQISAGQTISNYAKEAGDLAGPFYVCALSEQNVLENLENNYSRILFCSTGMATDTMLETDAFLNSRFFVQALSYMNESVDAIVVEPKYYTSTMLTITSSQANVLMWILVIILPLGILATGFVVWMRRKNM